MTNKLAVPSPQELIEARRVIRRLHRAVGVGHARDIGGMEMWGSLVEGGRAIAVATAYLGDTDPAYAVAWEKMMDDDRD